ncbi:hypothetical protein TWF730_002530 [Orbilia blumenaviensis]|uniref:F-box domain-containing protein n=1 Tax=Orbilia blumenaviensis TaxID=1796055 RepID=A0AAV9UEL0_9PEZI
MYPPIPPEVQDLILEAASHSQHPTLQLVCKRWNSSLSRIIKKQYRKLPNTDDAEIKTYFGKAHRAPGPELTPFLIHSAIWNFTGRVRIKEDWSGVTENIYQLDTNFEPDDDPETIAETLWLKECADDRVFILDTSSPYNLRYPVYLGWVLSDPQSVALAAQGGSSGHSFLASKNSRRDNTHVGRDLNYFKSNNTMRIAEFVSLYIQYTKHTARYPPLVPKGGRFVVHTGMWAPFYEDATPETMEAVKYINIKLVYMQ